MRNVSRENTLGGVVTIVPTQVVADPSGFPDDDPAGDQSMKKMALNCREAPSKVNMAAGTHRNSPHIAGKPGKLG